MNVEEYISSGILEAYVLDELNPAQGAEVEALLHQYPEVQEELHRIEATFESLAMATAVSPAAQVKKDLWNELDETPVISLKKETSSEFLRYAAAASLIIAVSAAVMAYTYWSKWQQAENKLSDVIAQNQQFAENYNQVNQKLEGIRESVAILNSSDYQRVVMGATDNAPGSQATVYWNASTKEVFLSIQNLKELSQEQQYQLWAIIDGKPVDAGVFDAGSSDMLLAMKNIGSGAAAFAVTVEPRGGSENPSLETMQVVGETQA